MHHLSLSYVRSGWLSLKINCQWPVHSISIADTSQRRLLQVVGRTLSLTMKTSIESSVAKWWMHRWTVSTWKKATNSAWPVTSAGRPVGLRVTCFERFTVLATLAHARTTTIYKSPILTDFALRVASTTVNPKLSEHRSRYYLQLFFTRTEVDNSTRYGYFCRQRESWTKQFSFIFKLFCPNISVLCILAIDCLWCSSLYIFMWVCVGVFLRYLLTFTYYWKRSTHHQFDAARRMILEQNDEKGNSLPTSLLRTFAH